MAKQRLPGRLVINKNHISEPFRDPPQIGSQPISLGNADLDIEIFVKQTTSFDISRPSPTTVKSHHWAVAHRLRNCGRELLVHITIPVVKLN
jgi:hypothetical protein